MHERLRRPGMHTLLVVGLLVGACGATAPSGPSWIDRAQVSAAPAGTDEGLDVEPTDGGGEDSDCAIQADAGSGGPGAGGANGQPVANLDTGAGNDPYTATGARQIPGPNMRLETPPAQPVTVMVAAPVDPDEHVAARNPEGKVTGPVPAPKLATDGTGSTGAAAQGITPAPGTAPVPGGADGSSGDVDCVAGGL